MSKNIKAVCGYFDEHKIGYEIFNHEPLFTIEECRKTEGIIGAEICKNLLLTTTNGNTLFLLLMAGEKKFLTKEISKKLGTSRLSFASSDVMRTVLNTQPGSLSVTSLIFDNGKKVRLAVDSDVFKSEYFCCHPSDNRATIKIKTAEIKEKLLPLLGITPIIIEL